MRSHKNFLFACGLADAVQRVRWSDAAESGTIPQSWDATAENLAGSVDLAPSFSEIREARTLRDDFLVYKGESIWRLTFIGGNAVFRAAVQFSEAGIAAPNCLTTGPNDEHLFVGSEGDLQLTDGVNIRPVLDGKAQRAFYDDFSANAERVFAAVSLDRENLGFIAYPRTGSSVPNYAVMFDFQSGAVGFRDMPDTLTAAEGSKLSSVGTQNTWDGDSQGWDLDGSSWNRVISAASVDDALIGGQKGFASISDIDNDDFLGGPVQARGRQVGDIVRGSPGAQTDRPRLAEIHRPRRARNPGASGRARDGRRAFRNGRTDNVLDRVRRPD